MSFSNYGDTNTGFQAKEKMNKELIQILCDPLTKEPLRLIDEQLDDAGQIVSGTLVSESGNRYPVKRGIPRFMPDAELAESVKSFGDEWNYFNYTDFKANWLAHAVKNTFGTPEAFKDKLIVDAGGGSGAQTMWMLESGAKHVIMLDLSHTVDNVVQRNLARSGFSNFDVVQCSIDAPPLRTASVDGIVYCHNVIQHTPSVEKTAEALFSLVAEGGEFVFNCYPLNDGSPLRWIRFHIVYWPIRQLLARAPFRVILAYARTMGFLRQVPIVGIILEKAGFCMQGDVPIRKGEGFLARVRRKFRTTTLITFDWFGSHQYQHHKSDDEMRALLQSLQPDPGKIKNTEAYFTRPQPIGCALRVFK